MVAAARERLKAPLCKGSCRKATEGLCRRCVRIRPFSGKYAAFYRGNPSVTASPCQLPLHKGAFGAYPAQVEPSYISAINDHFRKSRRSRTQVQSDRLRLLSISAISFIRSSRVSQKCSAPTASMSARLRKPQRTLMQGTPAFFAVSTSTSLSPT